MSRLTRDGTAEPVSRDQILRHARGQGNMFFPVQLTTCRTGNLTLLIHTLLYVMTIHTYIHTSTTLLGLYYPYKTVKIYYICIQHLGHTSSTKTTQAQPSRSKTLPGQVSLRIETYKGVLYRTTLRNRRLIFH